MKVLVLIWVCLFAFPAAAAIGQTPARALPHQPLERILHRPAYQRWHTPAHQPSSVTHGVQWINDTCAWVYSHFRPLIQWIRSIFKRPASDHPLHRSAENGGSGAGGSGGATLASALSYLLLIILTLVAIVLLAWMLWSLMSAQKTLAADATAVPAARDIKKAIEEGDALAQSSSQWLDLAGQLAESGNWRLTYRAMYLALLSGLHESGKIRFRRCDTNRIYARSYRGPAGEKQIFTDLTEIFDRVWYGHKPVAAGVRGQIEAQMRSLLTPSVPHE